MRYFDGSICQNSGIVSFLCFTSSFEFWWATNIWCFVFLIFFTFLSIAVLMCWDHRFVVWYLNLWFSDDHILIIIVGGCSLWTLLCWYGNCLGDFLFHVLIYIRVFWFVVHALFQIFQFSCYLCLSLPSFLLVPFLSIVFYISLHLINGNLFITKISSLST